MPHFSLNFLQYIPRLHIFKDRLSKSDDDKYELPKYQLPYRPLPMALGSRRSFFRIARLVLFGFLLITLLNLSTGDDEDGYSGSSWLFSRPNLNRKPREQDKKELDKQTAVTESTAPSASLGQEEGEDTDLYKKLGHEDMDKSTRIKHLESIMDDNIRRNYVKQAAYHAWSGYDKYAFGFDELHDKQGVDSIGGIGITIIDALDTLWIMGLKEEFEKGKQFVKESFDIFKTSKDSSSVFEINIRALGGLLSAFSLSNDSIFLEKAQQVGNALLPAFSSPHSIPYRYLNLKTGAAVNGWGGIDRTSLADAGTLQMEFTYLSHLTRNNTYRDAVEKAMAAIESIPRDNDGIYYRELNINAKSYASREMSVDYFGDSFFEYLLKQYLLANKRQENILDKYKRTTSEIRTRMIKRIDNTNMSYVGTLSNDHVNDQMGHLSCFYPGLLALGAKYLNMPEQLEDAERVLNACIFMYQTSTGLAGDLVQWSQTLPAEFSGFPFSMGSAEFLLRPETVESLFILSRITGQTKWKDAAWKIFIAIEKYCRTNVSYSGIRNVNSQSPELSGRLESWFLAETLKYLYLIFSPNDVISLDDWVFNTEAHPFRKFDYV